MTTNGHDPRLERTISGIALALLVIGCLLVLWPFMSSLLWAVVLCFSTWPLYRRLLIVMRGRRTLAALVMTLVVTLILLVPFLVVGFTLADNVRDLATAAKQWLEAGPPDPPKWLKKVPMIGVASSDYWVALAGDSKRLLAAMRGLIEPASALLLKGSLILGQGLVELTLSIFVAFFFYRDGIYLAERATLGAQRLAGERGRHLLVLAGSTVRSVVYGILGTAIVQGILAGLGFMVAGIPGAVVLALLTFFLSIIPMGPPLVWIPASLWLFYKGYVAWGIFMLFWGLVISSADNVVKPWLISQGSNMPFILIFFGVIGGAMAFGFIGVFLGPTLLAVGFRVIQEWVAPPPSPIEIPANV